MLCRKWVSNSSIIRIEHLRSRAVLHGQCSSLSAGIHAFVVDRGCAKESPVVFRDSSSALQLANRTGAGRLKHVEVRLLAILSWVAAECGECGRRAHEARIQGLLEDAVCAFEILTILSWVAAGRLRLMKVRRMWQSCSRGTCPGTVGRRCVRV